ncbi:unnamed protein product, partial [Medioppia subpectinata]
LITRLVLFVTVLCGLCLCTYSHGGGGGYSTSKRQQDDHGNYMFTYEIKDPKGGQNYRSEKGGPHSVQGSYGLQDIDGRMRVVDYWADGKNGFSAKIRSNEPGVGNQDSAYAVYNGQDSHGGEKTSMDINHADYGGKQGYGGGGGKW